MNKLLIAAIAAISMVFVGCDEKLPTQEQINKLANTAGMTAGYVVNMTKISNADKEIVVEIFKKIDECIPGVDQKFEDVWIPVANEYIKQLISEGKINESQGKIIGNASFTAVKAIDFAVYKKYPDIGERVDLITTAANGFTEGFLAVIKVDCDNCKLLFESKPINQEVYDYLTK